MLCRRSRYAVGWSGAVDAPLAPGRHLHCQCLAVALALLDFEAPLALVGVDSIDAAHGVVCDADVLLPGL